MARREFSVREIAEVLTHWDAGRGIRQIARSLGMDRNTVRKYIRMAEGAGLEAGQGRSLATWTLLVQKALPAVADPVLQSAKFGLLDRYRDEVREGLRTNTVATVWQRLVRSTGISVSLTTFRRYVRLVCADLIAAREVTVWRPEVDPGEEAQIDFGKLGLLCNPGVGQKRLAWGFFMILAYSRHMFVRPVWRLDLATWLECHVLGFEFFGGVPRRLVNDNLKGGVVKPDLYDPQLNRSYAELASYYGTLIDPARAGHPKDKPRVERVIPYVRESFWRGREFSSLEAAQGEALDWCRDVAGMRRHGTTGQRPLELFEREERDHLRPLPPQRWERALWTTAKVAQDSHVAVAGALYSIPWRYVGREVEVRLTERVVEVYLDGELIKTHLRRARGRQTDPNDLPPDKVAFFQRTPQWCLAQAALLGPAVRQAVEEILAVRTLYNLRQAQGILRQADRYGAQRLDAACARALAFGDPCYRTVKQILERGLDGHPVPQTADGETAPGALLHGPDAFALKPEGGRQP